jgi:hypothetical protein
MSKENILFMIFYLTYDTYRDIFQLWRKYNYPDFSVSDVSIHGSHETQKIIQGFAQSAKVPTGIDPGVGLIKRAREVANDES